MALTRKVARILAFQGLCAWEGGADLEDILSYSWIPDEEKEVIADEDLIFPTLLIRGTIEHIDEIDEKIKPKLEHWDFSRLSVLDKSNIRLGTYSLLYQKDTSPIIVINEAVRIAKEYSTDDAYKFVNAVLDSIKNSI
ncbi:MAG: transcription antitermination factor NusB [Treponema sp.]